MVEDDVQRNPLRDRTVKNEACGCTGAFAFFIFNSHAYHEYQRFEQSAKFWHRCWC